ncbi:MAG: putative transcriptional regulator, Crp/Fnr family [Bacteroidota bacterium]|nr:putative transcriptional regulator, Crp/Fnr family [Bacteroidota bacterium]
MRHFFPVVPVKVILMANLFHPNYTPVLKFLIDEKPSAKECIQYFTLFLSNFTFLKKTDIHEITTCWEFFSAKKNDTLLTSNRACDTIYFICKGAVKYYIEDEDGKYITAFLTEANFCAPVADFYSQFVSPNGAQCVEDVYGVKLSYKHYRQLIKKRIGFERFFEILIQQNAKHLKNRLKSFQSQGAQQRYDQLMQDNSEVFNRFMMQDISNYLGVKPETLSRMRGDRK